MVGDLHSSLLRNRSINRDWRWIVASIESFTTHQQQVLSGELGKGFDKLELRLAYYESLGDGIAAPLDIGSKMWLPLLLEDKRFAGLSRTIKDPVRYIAHWRRKNSKALAHAIHEDSVIAIVLAMAEADPDFKLRMEAE